MTASLGDDAAADLYAMFHDYLKLCFGELASMETHPGPELRACLSELEAVLAKYEHVAAARIAASWWAESEH